MWLKFWTPASLLKRRCAPESWTSQLWYWRHCITVSKGKLEAVLHRSGMEMQGTALCGVSLSPPSFTQASPSDLLPAPSLGRSIHGLSLCSSCWPEWGWGSWAPWLVVSVPLEEHRRCCRSATWQWLWSPEFYFPALADFQSVPLVNFVLSKFLYNALWLMQ